MAQSLGQPPEGQDDPLARLHRMSTTAGVSSQEYVAINPWAVTALVLGIASALAPLYPPLLVFPLGALLAGLIAFRQVGRSNGTQTGRGMALVSMGLALTFAALAGYRQVRQAAQVRGDTRQIARTVDDLWAALQKEDYAAAYDLHDEVFKSRFSGEEFARRWKQALASEPKVSKIEWNGVRPGFEQDPEGLSRYARARVKIHLPGGQAGDEWRFRVEDGRWKINQMPALFPTEEMQRRGGG